SGGVNHVKQSALGGHGPAEQHGLQPTSGVVAEKNASYGSTQDPVFDQESGKMFSWAVLLLPFLEETNLYNQFDQSRTALDQPNEPQETSVPVYLCPSDNARGHFYSDSVATHGKRFSKGNYAAYRSPMHTDLQLL